ncbi:hypothetical protein OS493_034876, partial [Desmophyllum pertusum]
DNIYNTEDHTFKVLRNLLRIRILLFFPVTKIPHVILLPRQAYIDKRQEMIDPRGNQQWKIQRNRRLYHTRLEIIPKFPYSQFQLYFTSKQDSTHIQPANQFFFMLPQRRTSLLILMTLLYQTSFKLRPIVSTCGTFCYETAQFLSITLEVEPETSIEEAKAGYNSRQRRDSA